MTTPTPTEDAWVTATRVMLALTGHRWTWPPRRTLEEYYVSETVDRINLSGRPVSAVESVVDRSGTIVYSQFELTDGFKLWIPALDYHYGWPWLQYGYLPRDAVGAVYPAERWSRLGMPIRVTYVYGSPPPTDVQIAINQFAIELDNATYGRPCQLPQRVTSVTREGVSWTILDPQQFLEGGKLGIYYPDLIISTYGNKVKARARVFSPEHAPPRRLWTQVLPLPAWATN